MRLLNLIRFRKDDPLRYLHVPKNKRLDRDEGPRSDATDLDSGTDIPFNRDEVRSRPIHIFMK